jgi:hypothetical protein
MMNLLTWLENSWLHRFMVDNPIAFTAGETVHFIGLTLLFGSLFLVDMRGLGFFKRMSLIELHRLVPIAILGFGLNLVTGIAFLAYDPANYLENKAFVWKMILVLIAGFNAILFEFAVFRPIVAGVPDAESRLITKLSSGLSLALWTGVLVLGRLIPFV